MSKVLKDGRHFNKKYNVFYNIENGKIANGVSADFSKTKAPFLFDADLNCCRNCFGYPATRYYLNKIIWK